MPENGGYDRPYHSGDVRMGRNKEITDDFTLRKQAEEVIANSRKSVKEGAMKEGDNGTEKKHTYPPLSV